jgi:hypothetical protein
MVAINRDYPAFNPAGAIDAEVAFLRAHGKSWDEAAAAIGWEAAELRRALRRDPNFQPMLAYAQREVEEEADAEGLALLRQLAKHDKPRIALDALKVITEYLTQQQHDRTRLAIEEMRHEAQMARANAKNAKSAKQIKAETEAAEQAAKEAEQHAETARRCKEAHEYYEPRHAEQAIQEQAIVFLWGGCHKIGNTPPDETDTPLYLAADSTVPGRRLYWVLANPPVTHPTNGPFLKPPGCRPATCPPLEGSENVSCEVAAS